MTKTQPGAASRTKRATPTKRTPKPVYADDGLVLRRVQQIVRQLKTLRQMSDTDIAERGGFSSRAVLNNRLTGRSDLDVIDLARIASALRVDISVLLAERVGDAVNWVDNNPDYVAPIYPPQPPMPQKAR